MRNKHLLLALVVVLLPPVLASAGTLADLTATADCNGWSLEATVAFDTAPVLVLLVVDVALTDNAGTALDHFHDEQWLTIPATPTAAYSYAASWPAPLDQPAQAVLAATVYRARGDVITSTGDERQVALTCPGGGGDTPTDTCHHAARWWLHRQGQWPVSALTLGGVAYDDGALVRLLRSPHRGNLARRLAHQLAVAKLNLANGARDDIGSVVLAADSWLGFHPLDADRRHQPDGRARHEGLRLIKDLCVWNHAACPDGSLLAGDDERDGEDTTTLTFDIGAAGAEFTGDLADYPAPDKAEEETTSLGTLKAMYR